MEAQQVVTNIEHFCTELLRLRTFYTAVNEYTSVPIDKSQARAFMDKYVSGVFADPGDVVRVTTYLTTKPSQYNSDKLSGLVCSNRNLYAKRLGMALGSTSNKLIKELLILIKEKLDEVSLIDTKENCSKVTEIKRCILMLPLIFTAGRDVALVQEQLIELPICEEELSKDADSLILTVKDMFEEKSCAVYLGVFGTEVCPVLNEKNWQSVKVVIARLFEVIEN